LSGMNSRLTSSKTSHRTCNASKHSRPRLNSFITPVSAAMIALNRQNLRHFFAKKRFFSRWATKSKTVTQR
jgi:hypothetical protein